MSVGRIAHLESTSHRCYGIWNTSQYFKFRNVKWIKCWEFGFCISHSSDEIADFVPVTGASLTARICPLFPALHYLGLGTRGHALESRRLRWRTKFGILLIWNLNNWNSIGQTVIRYFTPRSPGFSPQRMCMTIIATGWELPSFFPVPFLIITPPILHHGKSLSSTFLSDFNRNQYSYCLTFTNWAQWMPFPTRGEIHFICISRTYFPKSVILLYSTTDLHVTPLGICEFRENCRRKIFLF